MISLYVVFCTAAAACRTYIVEEWPQAAMSPVQCFLYSRPLINDFKARKHPHESLILTEYGCKVTGGKPL